MKRFFVAGLAAAVVLGAAAFAGKLTAPSELKILQEERNPWNHLRLNNDPADFQFAIVSDRTGGHRARVFSQAVEKLNLMQPEFVLSVGDLIEGGKEDLEKLAAEWQEFDAFISRLRMPFFYLPGNHDISNPVMARFWKERFGRPYYHFVYRKVLFLMVNTEDPPRVSAGQISTEQLDHFKRVLEENGDVRWTIVAMHKPLWTTAEVEKTGWLEFEKALAGRPYTVFAGHIHRYQRFLRNGQRYYQLATTGGGSKLRGTRYGEFDHVVWVTMKKDGPVLANLMVEGIYPEDLKVPDTEEPAQPRMTRPTQPVQGKVLFEGRPIPNARITFHLLDEKRTLRADALVEADGAYALSTYTAHDGAPAGEYAVTVVWLKPPAGDNESPGPNLLPAPYAKIDTTPLRATVKEGANTFSFDLKP
jgi:hypothetical protein